MTFPHRVRVIFVKELIDIMRDRRTLVALVLVPILLYPLLMLGAMQALSLQSRRLAREIVILGLRSEAEARLLGRIAEIDADVYAQSQAPAAPDTEPPTRQRRESGAAQHSTLSTQHSSADDDDDALRPLKDVDVKVDFPPDLEAAVKARQIHVGIVLRTDDDPEPTRQVQATLYYDPEEIRSATVFKRVQAVLQRYNEHVVAGRMDSAGIPLKALAPVVIEQRRITTPGSLLGQVLPLILVLMTITGAIYPAIDLTAGERERGTLETLMVCPVPTFDLIVGKFLVVTTVALIGAALNLASVSASVYFGGFERVVTGGGDQGFPLARLPLILLTLIPFAVLFSATMIAVCSFARTFKEAQNYVTPVILAALIPGGIAAVATPHLEGAALVVPVANMVLLTRELLLGSAVTIGQVAVVLLSTSIYAAAAVGLAARIFGQEAVVFADSGSLKVALQRRYFQPRRRPSAALVLLLISLLFPFWFYVQAAAQPAAADDLTILLRRTAVLMPLCFVLLPWAKLAYCKIDRRESFRLAAPGARFLLAALLLGVSLWVPAHEVGLAAQRLLGVPEGLAEMNRLLESAIHSLGPSTAILLLAIIPGVSEELLFRGFLMSGLSSSLRKWGAILTTAAIFGAFHFIGVRFPTTFAVGAVLGWLCWRSRSIWPSMLAHGLHNSVAILPLLWPAWLPLLRVGSGGETDHLPAHVLLGAGVLILLALWIARRGQDPIENRAGAAEAADAH